MTEEQNNPWVSVPEGDPDLVARQLLALRDWFELREVSVKEAACVIAGVLPPEKILDKRSIGARLPGVGACLPGLIEWEYNRELFDEVIADRIRRIEALLEEKRPFRGKSLSDFVVRGVAAGYAPPWLDAARNDPECREYLPPSLLYGEAQTNRRPLTGKQVASKGGKARWGNDDQRSQFLPLVEEKVRDGKGSTDILNELIDEFGDAPPRSTVFGWAQKIRAKLNDEKSE